MGSPSRTFGAHSAQKSADPNALSLRADTMTGARSQKAHRGQSGPAPAYGETRTDATSGLAEARRRAATAHADPGQSDARTQRRRCAANAGADPSRRQRAPRKSRPGTSAGKRSDLYGRLDMPTPVPPVDPIADDPGDLFDRARVAGWTIDPDFAIEREPALVTVCDLLASP